MGCAIGRGVAVGAALFASILVFAGTAKATTCNEAVRAAEREHFHSLALLPSELRLAIEMALHEDAERRALEGELAALEGEWRLAEEIAGIADELLLPDAARARLAIAPREGTP